MGGIAFHFDGYPEKTFDRLAGNFAEPRRKNGVNRHCRWTRSFASDQAAVGEVTDRHLHGAFRKSSPIGEDRMAHGDGFSACGVGVAIQGEVNKEGRGRTAMSDKVAQESVNQIWIKTHCYSNDSYSNACCVFTSSY